MCKTIVLLSIASIQSLGCGAVVGPDSDGAVAVAITSPAVGWPVSNSIEIAANAVAANGAVALVEFELPDGITVADRTPPFSTTWNSMRVGDGDYVIRATAFAEDGANSAAELAMTVDNARCLGVTAKAQDVPLGIPDDNTTGIKSAIQMQGPGAVAAVSLSLDISHQFPTDLDIELISPAGTPFSVWRHVDTSAERIVIDNQVISRFKGEQAAGTWSLRVVDDWVEAVGALDAWSLAIERDCSPPAL